MHVLAVANQKGGCGKTTTAINLAYSLSKRNRKVLLVDSDPQAHATMGLNIDADLDKNLYHVLTPYIDSRMDMREIIVEVDDRFHVAPSSMLVNSIEQELTDVEGRELSMVRSLSSVEKDYDIAVIDCPPSIGHICFNALRASTVVIIPIDMSLFSLRGVIKLVDIILFMKQKLHHAVTVRSLITMFDYRTRYARHVYEKVREEFGDNLFKTVIRYNIRLRETVDYGLPVGDYDKHSIGFADYEALAEEVVNAIENINVAHFSAEHIMKNARDYIAMSAQDENSTVIDNDECCAETDESAFTAMIDSMARNPALDDTSDDDDTQSDYDFIARTL